MLAKLEGKAQAVCGSAAHTAFSCQPLWEGKKQQQASRGGERRAGGGAPPERAGKAWALLRRAWQSGHELASAVDYLLSAPSFSSYEHACFAHGRSLPRSFSDVLSLLQNCRTNLFTSVLIASSFCGVFQYRYLVRRCDCGVVASKYFVAADG